MATLVLGSDEEGAGMAFRLGVRAAEVGFDGLREEFGLQEMHRTVDTIVLEFDTNENLEKFRLLI